MKNSILLVALCTLSLSGMDLPQKRKISLVPKIVQFFRAPSTRFAVGAMAVSWVVATGSRRIAHIPYTAEEFRHLAYVTSGR